MNLGRLDERSIWQVARLKKTVEEAVGQGAAAVERFLLQGRQLGGAQELLVLGMEECRRKEGGARMHGKKAAGIGRGSLVMVGAPW